MAEPNEVPGIVDAVITVTSVAKDDEGHPYAVTRVFRYEFETLDNALEWVETAGHNNPLEGGQMRNV